MQKISLILIVFFEIFYKESESIPQYIHIDISSLLFLPCFCIPWEGLKSSLVFRKHTHDSMFTFLLYVYVKVQSILRLLLGLAFILTINHIFKIMSIVFSISKVPYLVNCV